MAQKSTQGLHGAVFPTYPPKTTRATLIIEDTDTHIELEDCHIEMQREFVDADPRLGSYEHIVVRAKVGDGHILRQGGTVPDLTGMRTQYSGDHKVLTLIDAYEELYRRLHQKGK